MASLGTHPTFVPMQYQPTVGLTPRTVREIVVRGCLWTAPVVRIASGVSGPLLPRVVVDLGLLGPISRDGNFGFPDNLTSCGPVVLRRGPAQVRGGGRWQPRA